MFGRLKLWQPGLMFHRKHFYSFGAMLIVKIELRCLKDAEGALFLPQFLKWMAFGKEVSLSLLPKLSIRALNVARLHR